jgi:PAS domain S-box-containing protein
MTDAEIGQHHEMSAQRLLRRSRRLLWLTLLPLLLLVLLLAAWQAVTQFHRVIDDAAAEARVQRFAFEVMARDAAHHVADLAQTMRDEFLRGPGEPAPALAAALQPRRTADGRDDGWSLDALPTLLGSDMAQVVWPRGDTAPTPATLHRAQVFAATVEPAHRRNPDLIGSYYFGLPDRHVVLYPWAPSQGLIDARDAADLSSRIDAWYRDETVTAGLPEANPVGEAYWTAPTVDPGGRGLLVAHAVPVVVAETLRGVVATQVRLATLERLLGGLAGAPWEAWVIDARGHVLADRQQLAAGSAQAAFVAERLPPGIDAAVVAQAAAARGEAIAVQGRRVIALRVLDAPWTVVLAAPDRALWLAVLPQVLPYSLIALVLLVVGAAGQVLLRRRVLTPVLQVLGYLQRLSADASTPEPQLGPRWQPWVRMVTATFASMRSAAQREMRADALKSAIVDHAQSAVVVADAQGRVVEFNPAAVAMLGLPREAAVGRPMGDLLIPDRFRDRFDTAIRRMRDGDPDGMMGRRMQRISRRADGSEFPVEVVVWMTQVGGAEYFTASMTDQTEARAAAEVIDRQRDALRQSEKLTAMGSLLAGVAHELNNPLAIVMGRASLLEEKTAGSPLQTDAVRIREAAERCGRIVRTFLNMARSKPAQRGPVRLNDLARAAADMLGYTLRSHGIELELQLADSLPEVEADGDQIGQVVLNLIVNAQQALAAHDGPRRIVLRSGGADGAEASGVWLRVADSGPGVAPAARDKLFEPFFTTKAEGIGTGLGLSVSRAIVREHGGELTLESRPPDAAASRALPGASFLMRLPLRAAAPAAAPGAAAAPIASPAAGAARVLVIDDEPEITELLRTMLEGAGHEVASADTGAVALELLAAARFDAIVSDLRMPDLDGAALWRAVRERHPALAQRMLFVTGDTLSPGARQFLDQTGCPRLEKPFDRHELLALLAPLLRDGAVASSG